MSPQWGVPAGAARAGVGRADITPPPDAYHRNWGAALHDRAEGIHRPLYATALVLSARAGGRECALVTLDLGWLRRREMERLLRQVGARAQVDAEHLVVSLSHTHAAINLDLDRAGEPGGEHIAPYLEALPERIAAALEAARQGAVEAHVDFARGRCNLAWQRDYWDAARRIYTCGPNPEAAADDALLVMRATSAAGKPLFFLVNYACHPTTLAWENRLISPDYIGAMRACIEAETGVPCLFVQGASGDLGPRDGFVGDVEVAERNGRQLGHAALAAIESLPPPATRMRYEGPRLSGATLGIWRHGPAAVDEVFRTAVLDLELAARPLPSRAELEAQLERWQRQEDEADDEAARSQCRARIERLRRARRRLEEGDSGRLTYRIHLWQVGGGAFVLLGGEPYSFLQRALRRRFAASALVVAALCNQPHSYILPRAECGKGLYQDSCATLAPGALEEIIAAIEGQLQEWGFR